MLSKQIELGKFWIRVEYRISPAVISMLSLSAVLISLLFIRERKIISLAATNCTEPWLPFLLLC